MPNSLSIVRTGFGRSQDAMASALGVSVRTIARWEAAQVPTTNPFLTFVWVSATRHASRLYRYAKHLVPKSYIEDVNSSPYERAVYVGDEAVVLAMSQETKRTWGVFRYAEGISVAAFSGKAERALMVENYSLMSEICWAGDSSRIVNFVTSDAPPGSIPPLWRWHQMHAPFPGVFDMRSVPISEPDFLATEPKFWITGAAIAGAGQGVPPAGQLGEVAIGTAR